VTEAQGVVARCDHRTIVQAMNDREVAYAGAGLKLTCPAPIGGRVVSVLIRGGGDEIAYQVSAGAPVLPWPPGPTWTGERCQCETCAGRVVGATVEELRAKVDDMDSDYMTNVDTFFLRYLESARDVIVREAQYLRYGIQRDISTFTDTYVRAGRQVAVRYDDSFQEVTEVRVVYPRTDESYPGAIAGALAALRGRGS
jgi:predicted NBD/HSP70 family sugar kinase